MTQVTTFNPILIQSRSRSAKTDKPAEQPAAFAGETSRKMATVPSALQKVYFGGLREARQIALNAITPEKLNEETEVLSWNEYLEKVYQNPRVVRDSYQRIYDMISSQPKHEAFTESGKPIRTSSGDRVYSYEFFTNPGNGGNTIAGMEKPLHQLVRGLEAAAHGGDTRNRFFMLKGPVGTAKSTVVNVLKSRLEEYSRTEAGAMYALGWKDIPKEVAEDKELQLSPRKTVGADGQEHDEYFYIEPMSDDPLRVIPEENGMRKNLLGDINKDFAKQSGGRAPYKLDMKGDLSPASFLIRQKLLEYYQRKITSGEIKLKPGETLMSKVLEHVEARRYILSERGRKGIGTYVPKDAKNQDSTELNGDIDYSKLPMYGDPNHPLVQAYRGEFNVANRGIMDFEEILKLQREFLYDLLHASQERVVKPKNGTMLAVDMFIVGKTNMEELDEKVKDEKMKAFFNRAVEIAVPYLMDPKKEASIYNKGFVRLAKEDYGYEMAPHAVDIAALWAVLTRQDPEITKSASMADGRGFYGVSPRFLQNVFDQVLVHSQTKESGAITPFTILRVIQEQLQDGAIKDTKNMPRYLLLLDATKRKLTDMVQHDVLSSIQGDKDLMRHAYLKYVKNLALWANEETRDRADERYLRQVETKMRAPVNETDLISYRQNLLDRINTVDGGPVVIEYDVLDEDENLRNALAELIFDDLKNQLDSVPEDKIVKAMGKQLHYPPEAARQALEHLKSPNGIL